MKPIENPKVAHVFDDYPQFARDKLLLLRQLILETAAELESVGAVKETLKWGEPSFLVEDGSTVKINWKQSSPDQYGIYFICSTNLVEVFRALYSDLLKFEGNRGIVLNLNDEIPVDEVKHCISLTLQYHKLKHLPMLGV